MTSNPTPSMSTGLSTGLSLKAQHFDDALAVPGVWFEIHPENYFVAGGQRLKTLDRIREDHELSLHGVGLSLAADVVDADAHLTQLKALVDRFQPRLMSEHLAWSMRGQVYQPDLLPFPRTQAALTRMVQAVDRAQTRLQRQILIENPSHYLRLKGHAYSEIEFLDALARRTGCGLLIDVNNVFVSAANIGGSAEAYIDAIPADLVGEIHVAGHSEDPNLGPDLLIDSHDAAVSPAVWRLAERLLRRIGPRPLLIERDGKVPDFAELWREREAGEAIWRAGAVAKASSREVVHAGR